MTVYGVRIQTNEKHQSLRKESNKKVLSGKGGGPSSVAGSGKQAVSGGLSEEEGELVENNGSEWDESLNNSQDPRWRD